MNSNMEIKADLCIGILAFIWSNVATDKVVGFGAAIIGLLFIVGAVCKTFRK